MKKTLTALLAGLALAAGAGEVEYYSVPMATSLSVMSSNAATVTNLPFRLSPSDGVLGVQTVGIVTNAQASNAWFSIEFSVDGTSYTDTKVNVTNTFTASATNVTLQDVTIPKQARWARLAGTVTNSLTGLSNVATLSITFGQHRQP